MENIRNNDPNLLPARVIDGTMKCCQTIFTLSVYVTDGRKITPPERIAALCTARMICTALFQVLAAAWMPPGLVDG